LPAWAIPPGVVPESPPTGGSLGLALVLLQRAVVPDPHAYVAAAADLGVVGLVVDDVAHERGKDALSLTLPGGGFVVITAIAAAHPDAPRLPVMPTSPPADEVAKAPAHAILVVGGAPGSTREVDALVVRLTGALLRTTPAIAAMLGHGVGLHKASVFLDMARALDEGDVPIELSVDLTAAVAPGGRASVLSHGLARYGREELLVTADRADLSEAYELGRRLVRWLGTTDEVPATGDTIGRGEARGLVVKRGKSPTGDGTTVIRIDL
jgi:hypothetical protein